MTEANFTSRTIGREWLQRKHYVIVQRMALSVIRATSEAQQGNIANTEKELNRMVTWTQRRLKQIETEILGS